MYAVIFKAKTNKTDQAYTDTVNCMRKLAVNTYGCIEINSYTQDDVELTISYWPSKDHIKKWKNNPEHQRAQKLGKSKWYKSYKVQVVKVINQYNVR